MNKTLSILLDGQDPAIKRQIKNRVSALMSNVRFMRESETKDFIEIERKGWTEQRLETLFALNSFYLFVLGPLASSAKGRSKTMWHNIPILYGDTLVFDAQRAQKIRAAQVAFSSIAGHVPGGLDTLSANQAHDIVFRLNRALQAEARYGSMG